MTNNNSSSLNSCLSFRHSFVIWFSSFVLLVVGCGGPKPPPPPTLHPVHGAVKYSDGTPLTGGMVQFQMESGNPVTVTAEIQRDGTFELKTMHVNSNLPGAMEGSYKVMVLPPVGTDPTSNSAPAYLPQPLAVKPGENNFPITIENK